jgi:hypothetical protein
MSDETNNDTHDDRELASWRGEWKTLGEHQELAVELVARAAKDRRRMRNAAAREVLGAAFSTAFCLWMLVRSRGTVEIVAVCALVLAFNGAWLTQFFMVRVDLFATSGEGLEDFLALTRRRLATELRWARIARRWLLALCVLTLPWAVWMFVAHQAAYAAAPWRGVIGFGGAAAIFAGVYVWTRWKERALSVEAEAFERHVADARLA